MPQFVHQMHEILIIYLFFLVECVDPRDEAKPVNQDDKDGFDTTDNFVEGNPDGPSDTPDEDVPSFGNPEEIPIKPENPIPYTVVVKTPEGTEDRPMVIDIDTTGVQTIRVSVPGGPTEEVRAT